VILSHSGAFLKYLGRLDLVLRENPADPRNGFEIASHEYTLFPVDRNVPEDPAMKYMLEPYENRMDQLIDLDRLIGYAPNIVRRFGTTGGDSALGNLVADSMWVRTGIETDFALTNTTGIRTDLNAGPVTTEELFNVFPFDNTITTMFLSGLEVWDLFDYVARRTASRGCSSQAQIAGAQVVLNCRGCERTGGLPCAESIKIGSGTNLVDVVDTGSYELATNNYLAQGGSGYVMLRRNTTQQDSGIPQRDAVIDLIRGGPPCVEPRECADDAACGEGQLCVCTGRFRWNDTTGTCLDDGVCAGPRRCVLEQCVSDVANMYALRVAEPGDDEYFLACGFGNNAADECAEAPCVDGRIGAVEDARIRAYLP
jgi:5'-nucleotidase